MVVEYFEACEMLSDRLAALMTRALHEDAKEKGQRLCINRSRRRWGF